MKVTRFDPSDSLIVVRAWLWGPRGKAKLDLALDTAATHTHIVPDIVDELGYNPRQGEGITMVHSAIGEEPGYLMRVSRFQALGFSTTDFRIHVHDLGEGSASTACSASRFYASSISRSDRQKVDSLSIASTLREVWPGQDPRSKSRS